MFLNEWLKKRDRVSDSQQKDLSITTTESLINWLEEHEFKLEEYY
jgi:hypothetical protein